MWAPQQCFWTGYRNRLVLLIFDVDSVVVGDFNALQLIIATLDQMARNCPYISCLDAPLTRPAGTMLTISLQRPTSNAHSVGPEGTDSTRRDTGVTIRDMILLLVRVTISLFGGYSDTMDGMILCAKSLQALLS